MDTPWDARTYDRSSAPQQEWAGPVLARLADIAPDATVLDVGCGTGRVTEALLSVPRGRVLAIDASPEMVGAARERLGERAVVRCGDVLDLELGEPVDAIVSTAALHWVRDHDALWPRLAHALRPAGRLEVQCGGNIAGVLAVIEAVARDGFPELAGWTRWTFADRRRPSPAWRPRGSRRSAAGWRNRPTTPEDVDAFVRTSILPAHLARLPEDRREAFARRVVAGVTPPLDYVRLNVSAVRAP